MRHNLVYIALLVIFLLITGCSRASLRKEIDSRIRTTSSLREKIDHGIRTQFGPKGTIYSHTTRPLDLNFSKTPKGGGRGEEGDIKHFYYYVHVLWDTNAIGDIAKQNGIETIYYADIETLKVLGYWNQYTVHIYGK